MSVYVLRLVLAGMMLLNPRIMWMRLFPIAVLMMVPSAAMAQDGGYVPPPMFGEPGSVSAAPALPPAAPPSQRVLENRILTEGHTSVRVPQGTAVRQAPPVAPVAPSAPAVPSNPVSAAKKMQPVLGGDPAQARKAPVAVVTAPPVPPKKPAAVAARAPAVVPASPAPVPPAAAKTIPGANKVTHAGVVQGPKTMPAVPAQAVEAQPIADMSGASEGASPVDSGQTIMQRHQAQMAARQKAKAPVAAPAPAPEKTTTVAKAADLPPTGFEEGATQAVLKKVLPYAPGQTALEKSDLALIGSGVAQELGGRKDWRVQIRAFATPYGSGASSDKRIALSRAIALRKSLVAQGVQASRIDILAEGQKPQGGDKVDLYLYSPKDKPQVF